MRYSTLLDAGRFTIFLFHGVVREHRHTVRNYTRKHLDEVTFTGILDDLAAHGMPVSLSEILAIRQRGGALPERAFAVTFDDGFENNASVAAPLLRQWAIPATFYVTTGFVDGGGVSWIDMIEAAVEATPEVRLRLPCPAPPVCRTPEEKRALLDAVRAWVKPRPDIDPYAFAREVCEELGATALPPDPELDGKLSWDQVRELDADRLFTVGGHGHTHRVLEHLPDDELAREIMTSLEMLSDGVGHAIEHYSYPEGLRSCYSPRVIKLLRANGIVCAPSAEPGTNGLIDDPFHWKRVMVA